MTDIFSPEKRSEIMRGIRGRGNRTTELRLIVILRSHGISGWRRGWTGVGQPDFAFPKERVVVFVDGCFWHGCPKCYRLPASNTAFWQAKLDYNRKHDLEVKRKLCNKGWRVLRFWECQLKNAHRTASRIRGALTHSLNEARESKRVLKRVLKR